MNKITILPEVTVGTTWMSVDIPDNVRGAVSFQLTSLGVLSYSLDGGVTSMKVVGTGETLYGNFSRRTLYFKIDSGEDSLQMRVQD